MNRRILKIESSGRRKSSVSRKLANQLVEILSNEHSTIIDRDLAERMPFIDDTWIAANNTPDEERSDEQRQVLRFSDELINEWEVSDTVIISVPIYNFGVPASLKAYIDQICRARRTFRYSASGPEGLLRDRPVYLIFVSGGTAYGSDQDFASGFLEHILKFIGIRNIRVIRADSILLHPTRISKAESEIASIAFSGATDK